MGFFLYSGFGCDNSVVLSGFAIFCLFTIVSINLLEIFGPYYTDFRLYFSDLRNWFLYPLILLIPVIYTIVSENRRFLKRKRAKKTDMPHILVRFGFH